MRKVVMWLAGNETESMGCCEEEEEENGKQRESNDTKVPS